MSTLGNDQARCDICGKAFEQEQLISFYPESNEALHDLREEFSDFDGKACPTCYSIELAKQL